MGMTSKEAIEQIKLDMNMCKFNPLTGEEEFTNEQNKRTYEADKLAIEALHLLEKKEQGLVVEYPSGIGDTVYLVDFENKKIDPSRINDIAYDFLNKDFQFDSDYLYFYSDDIGKTVFLTKVEAEQALKEREKNEVN